MQAKRICAASIAIDVPAGAEDAEPRIRKEASIMRRVELIRKLKDNRKRLRAINAAGSWMPDCTTAQQKSEKRLVLLHDLENLLPEIIEKLERSS